MPESKQKEDETSSTASSVLHVRGFEPDKVSIQELCNLFSNFGNVERGMMHTSKKFALIKYCSKDAAALGMKYCNKLQINGIKLSINYSRFDHIDED